MKPNDVVKAGDLLHKLHQSAMELHRTTDADVGIYSLARILRAIDDARIPEPTVRNLLEFSRRVLVDHHASEVESIKRQLHALGVEITDADIAHRVAESAAKEKAWTAKYDAEHKAKAQEAVQP